MLAAITLFICRSCTRPTALSKDESTSSSTGRCAGPIAQAPIIRDTTPVEPYLNGDSVTNECHVCARLKEGVVLDFGDVNQFVDPIAVIPILPCLHQLPTLVHVLEVSVHGNALFLTTLKANSGGGGRRLGHIFAAAKDRAETEHPGMNYVSSNASGLCVHDQDRFARSVCTDDDIEDKSYPHAK